ncbi:MAG: nuclear transport factor 2 family protein [Bdellovibrionota bacterium]
MGTKQEIMEMEEKLRMAELGPDPKFFASVLSDDALIDGQKVKQKIVAAHQPGKGPKFTKVIMSDYDIVDHGNAAVVVCQGVYEGPEWSGTIRFMRTWLKKEDGWKIISGSTLVNPLS